MIFLILIKPKDPNHKGAYVYIPMKTLNASGLEYGDELLDVAGDLQVIFKKVVKKVEK